MTMANEPGDDSEVLVDETPHPDEAEGKANRVPLTGQADIDACRVLVDECAHRNIFTTQEVNEFMLSDLFADNPAAQYVIDEFRENPRGPSFNDFVPATVLSDFALDVMNACSVRVRE